MPGLVIAAVAAIALGLAGLVSKIIRNRSREDLAEAGSGDEPGEPGSPLDRGPEGIKL
jgi:hypothetical protein